MMTNKKSDVYSQFVLATLKFDAPRQYGYDWFTAAIDKIWEVKWLSVNWSELEKFTRDCLGSPYLDDREKVQLLQEAIGAFTGRGTVARIL